MTVNIFFCYAHEDELFLNKLMAYLRPLQRQGLIDVWYDRDISAGIEWEREISEHLDEAKIILLLVSPDFMNSDYSYSVEMKRALERHKRKEAIVIPVILRPIYWQGELGNLQALPTDAKPVVDRSWHTVDDALYDVAEGVRAVVVQLGKKPVSSSEVFLSQVSKRESEDASLTILSPQPEKTLLKIKPEEFRLLRTLEGHSGSIRSITINPDSQTFVSGSVDETVRIWNLHTGELLNTLKGHLKWAMSTAISSDGQILAVGCENGKSKLWNLSTGRKMRILSEPFPICSRGCY